MITATPEPMNESDMMHGYHWDRVSDVSGWYGSEKLNGCRSYWDGERFWTRGGNVVKAPARIVRQMPRCHIDGEFYAGPGRLQEARVAVQYGRFTDAVRFVAFDAPEAPCDWLQRIAVALSVYPLCVAPFIVESSPELIRRLADIRGSGGEGIVLHQPGAEYVRERTRSVLKITSIL